MQNARISQPNGKYFIMIARIWQGKTTRSNASLYEAFLLEEFIPSIADKKIPGYRRFQLLKKEEEGDLTFITIMWFDSLEKVKSFAGENYEKAVIHPKAMQWLKEHDAVARHFELVDEIQYP